MPESVYICDLDDIEDPGSRGFSLVLPGETVNGFLVRKNDSFYAYRNQCPHRGAPLEWTEHQFLDREGELIQCSMHDARFIIDTGLCISGPCPGAELQSLAIEKRGDALYLLKP